MGHPAAVPGPRGRARRDATTASARNRFVTRYAYHHGYFDGVEREFRGFGMVEQWDTEEFAALRRRRRARREQQRRRRLARAARADEDMVPHRRVSTRSSEVMPAPSRRSTTAPPRPDDPNHAAALAAFLRTLLPDTILPDGLTLRRGARGLPRAQRARCCGRRSTRSTAPARRPHPLHGHRAELHGRAAPASREATAHAVFFAHRREALSLPLRAQPGRSRASGTR